MPHTSECHPCVQNLAWFAKKILMYTKPSSKYQGDISYKMRIDHYSLPTGQSVKLLHSAADVSVLTRFTVIKYLKLATGKSVEHPGTAAPC